MGRFISKMAVMVLMGVVLVSFGCASKNMTADSGADEVKKVDTSADDKAAMEEAEKMKAEKLMQEKMAEEKRAKMEAKAMFENKKIYFSFDSASLTKAAQEILKGKASWLMANSTAQITIEGHCDSRGTTEYNMALGERRAESVKKYLKALGIESSRVKTITYGEEKPDVAGENESAWAKNRRAEFVIDSGLDY